MTMMVFVACGDDDVLPIGDGSSSSGVSSAGVVSSASLASQGSSGFSASSAASSLPVYTVNFDSQGGSSVEAQTIPSGGKVSLPASPAWGVSIFRGWYRDAGAALPWNFSVDTVTNALTLYAGWTIRYEVRFDSCGGSPVAAQRIAPGGKVAFPPTPLRGVAVLKGWYRDVAGLQPWDFAADTVTNTVTLYATWQDREYTDLVSVPGGTFVQTEAEYDGTAGPSFSHTISAFAIGKYEVTYEIWYTVYTWATNNGYQFANAGREGNDGTIGAAPTSAMHEPVTSINWRDAIMWCNAYSQMDGKNPVYCSDSGFATPIKNSQDESYGYSVDTTAGSFDNPYVNWNANGYRLPTEGEWQYAASYKDGSSWTPYNYTSGALAGYTDTTASGLVAWYNGNASTTKTVGTKGDNALGLYDMSGNIWEWCWDWYDVTVSVTTNDYQGPVYGEYRSLRGAGYSDPAENLQVGYRVNSSPFYIYVDSGFRVARSQ